MLLAAHTIHAKSILLTNWILCSLPFSIYTIHILLSKLTAKTISGCEKKTHVYQKIYIYNVDWDFCEREEKRTVCRVQYTQKYQRKKNCDFFSSYKYIVMIVVTYYLLSSTCVRIQSSLCITCERKEKTQIKKKEWE